MNFFGRLRQRKALNKSNGKVEVLSTIPYNKQCKYPTNEASRGNEFVFCCAEIENDAFPYCTHHCKIAYTNYEQIKNKKQKRPVFSGNIKAY